jgi:hypothetical protein
VKYLTVEGKKRSKPICGQCMADIADAERWRFEEEEWVRRNPGVDREQQMIDDYHKRKYGEY